MKAGKGQQIVGIIIMNPKSTTHIHIEGVSLDSKVLFWDRSPDDTMRTDTQLGHTAPPTQHHCILPGTEVDCVFLYLSFATAQSTATVRPVRHKSSIRRGRSSL